LGSDDDDRLFSYPEAGDYYYQMILGEEGDDIIMGGELDDELYGGDDDDVLNGGEGRDSFDGGEGNDTVSFEGALPIEGSDLYLGAWVDLAFGSGGWAAYGEIFVSTENLIGSECADRLFGNDEDNVLDGGKGMDHLMGRRGNDTLIGGGLHDRLEGGEGDDTLDGGDGRDILSYTDATSAISVGLLSGTRTRGDAAGDIVQSFESVSRSVYDDEIEGDDKVNFLFGGDGSDEISGAGDDDRLSGDDGDDELFGDAGDDALFGGADSDYLAGGPDDDYLEGGGDADEFQFERGWGDDEIDDFEDGSDLIGISGPGWTELDFIQYKEGVLITYDSDSILLYGTEIGDFSAADIYTFIPN
jgi:Ca2+-binding RTX toxin-like protein